MTLPIRPYIMYKEDVYMELSRRNLWVSSEWFDSMVIPDGRHRCALHQEMGLTPEESAEELRPYAKAAMNPLCDLVGDMRKVLSNTQFSVIVND